MRFLSGALSLSENRCPPRDQVRGQAFPGYALRRRAQRLNREVALRVGPGAGWRPAGAARQRAEGLDRVFVAVLGVDGLAGAEFDRAPGDFNGLPPAAREMHFNPAAFPVVEGLVAERVEIEVSAKLAVDAAQQVEVELGGH